MGWLISFDIINRYQPAVQKTMHILNRLIEPVLNQLRRFIPVIAGIDMSPLVLFLLIGFVKNVLYTYLYKW
jgi:YggT family protein